LVPSKFFFSAILIWFLLYQAKKIGREIEDLRYDIASGAI